MSSSGAQSGASAKSSWVDQTSSGGNRYSASYQNEDEMTKANAMETKSDDAGAAGFTGSATVDWELGSSGDLKSLGIAWYAMGRQGGIYDYTLNFSTDGAMRTYYFTDKSGDTYKKLVLTGGGYTINYNSSNPVITKVERYD